MFYILYFADAFDCVSKSYMVYLETAWNTVRASGDRTRGTIIIDIAGGGLGMLGYIAVVKRIANSGVLMYPEINERVTIVNAGWFISTLWAAVRPFIPKRTDGKIKILNTEYQEIIHADIVGGSESLPVFLGGSLDDMEHRVCPAQSVDSAYGSILSDICSGASTYPDSEYFLKAALQHARSLSSSSLIHRDREIAIKKYLAANKYD